MTPNITVPQSINLSLPFDFTKEKYLNFRYCFVVLPHFIPISFLFSSQLKLLAYNSVCRERCLSQEEAFEDFEDLNESLIDDWHLKKFSFFAYSWLKLYHILHPHATLEELTWTWGGPNNFYTWKNLCQPTSTKIKKGTGISGLRWIMISLGTTLQWSTQWWIQDLWMDGERGGQIVKFWNIIKCRVYGQISPKGVPIPDASDEKSSTQKFNVWNDSIPLARKKGIATLNWQLSG